MMKRFFFLFCFISTVLVKKTKNDMHPLVLLKSLGDRRILVSRRQPARGRTSFLCSIHSVPLVLLVVLVSLVLMQIVFSEVMTGLQCRSLFCSGTVKHCAVLMMHDKLSSHHDTS